MTTPFSTLYEPGAVVSVRIRFTSGGGIKRRPAVVLTDDKYHQSRADAIVVALSTRVGVTYYGDCDLVNWRQAGLPLPTKAKGVVETIARSTVERRYGTLSPTDLRRVQDSVRLILGL